MESFVLQSIWW